MLMYKRKGSSGIYFVREDNKCICFLSVWKAPLNLVIQNVYFLKEFERMEELDHLL